MSQESQKVSNGVNIQFITVPGCVHCAAAKEVFEELKPRYPEMEIEEVDATTPKGMELVSQYSILASPGIVINGELFSTGGLDKKKFIEKLDSLKQR